MVGGRYGTALAAAVSTDIVSLLLERGADVMRVGGSYLTGSGTYPSALDVALSEGSRADPTLVVRLRTAISGRTESSMLEDVISRMEDPEKSCLPNYVKKCVICRKR